MIRLYSQDLPWIGQGKIYNSLTNELQKCQKVDSSGAYVFKKKRQRRKTFIMKNEDEAIQD
jgi:hypothetical protein